MTKDEMKNRISMALKDPILQQGFEIICKEIAQLKEANQTLATMNESMWVELEMKRAESQGIMNRLHQLAKAKEIIKGLLLAEEGNYFCDVHADREHIKARKKAEEFLKEEL